MSGKKGKKVNVNLYLPEDATNLLRDQLKDKGMTLSGFLSSIITEYASMVGGKGSVLSKSIDEITLPELVGVMDHWVKRIRALEE